MPSTESQRLASVDALRGLTVAAMIFVNDPGDWWHIFGPFGHAAWHGWTPTDLIFPTFLFIAGVSLSLAGGPVRESGADTTALQRVWWRRALRLLLLGWVLAAIAVLALPRAADDAVPWRPMGVLPRIALCCALAGWLYLHASARTRWAVWAGLLAGYGALLSWWGDLSPYGSLPSRVDAWVLGPLAYHHDPATGLAYDPEGLPSSLGALSNTLLGTLCGDALRRGRLGRLVMGGAALVAAGLALQRGWMPMNKSLWTPPFALFSGGVSVLALALVHGLVDRRGWPPLGRVFGLHAITAYAGSILLLCLLDGTPLHAWIYTHDFSWMVPYVGPRIPSHLYALAQVLLWWGVLRWMDSRGLRLRL